MVISRILLSPFFNYNIKTFTVRTIKQRKMKAAVIRNYYFNRVFTCNKIIKLRLRHKVLAMILYSQEFVLSFSIFIYLLIHFFLLGPCRPCAEWLLCRYWLPRVPEGPVPDDELPSIFPPVTILDACGKLAALNWLFSEFIDCV